MRKILYLIFALFFLRGFFQIFEGPSWTLSFGSIFFSMLGIFFLYKKYEIFLIGVYYLSKKDINQPRFCGETDITLDYGSRIQGSNPCRTAILKF